MPRRRFDLEQFNPFCRPDWRWQLVSKIASGELPRCHGLDDAIKAAIAFRRCREQSDAYPRRRRKGPHDAAIAAALEMQKVGGLAEWEVRARLLAGQSDAEIAAQCNLSEETVNLYGQLFFDVRDHLCAWVWVCSQVFGTRLRHGFGDDLGLIWQALAYFGGVQIVDAVIAASKACCRPGELPTVSACLAEGSTLPVAMRAVLAMMVVPQVPALDMVFIAMQPRVMELPTIESPDAAAAAQDHIAKEVVEAARAVLAGKPIPQPRFQPGNAQAARPPAQVSTGDKLSGEGELGSMMSVVQGDDSALGISRVKTLSV